MQPYLYCAECGAQYSADARDYSWRLDPKHVFTCCEQPMQIIQEMHVQRVLSSEATLADLEHLADLQDLELATTGNRHYWHNGCYLEAGGAYQASGLLVAYVRAHPTAHVILRGDQRVGEPYCGCEYCGEPIKPADYVTVLTVSLPVLVGA